MFERRDWARRTTLQWTAPLKGGGTRTLQTRSPPRQLHSLHAMGHCRLRLTAGAQQTSGRRRCSLAHTLRTFPMVWLCLLCSPGQVTLCELRLTWRWALPLLWTAQRPRPAIFTHSSNAESRFQPVWEDDSMEAIFFYTIKRAPFNMGIYSALIYWNAQNDIFISVILCFHMHCLFMNTLTVFSAVRAIPLFQVTVRIWERCAISGHLPIQVLWTSLLVGRERAFWVETRGSQRVPPQRLRDADANWKSSGAPD